MSSREIPIKQRSKTRSFITASCFAIFLSACSDSDKFRAFGNVSVDTGDMFSESSDNELLELVSPEEKLRTEDTKTQKLKPGVLVSRIGAARLLNQATFGATPETVRELQLMGRKNWLQDQMSMPNNSEHFETMRASYIQGFRPLEEDLIGMQVGGEFITNQAWQSWIEAPDQLRKRVAAALLEIFVVTARVDAVGIGRNQMLAASFLDLLEKHAFGNYRELLNDVSRHAAMAHYLSFIDNQKAEYDAAGVETRVPDENYAREILQLFSIGLYKLNIDGSLTLNASGEPIETYEQSDIMNLARVFTGWIYDASQSGQMRFHLPLTNDASLHSPEEKRFLGKMIPANTDAYTSLDQAIDHISTHANVGPFIGKQLIQRLVSSNPTPEYVERVANVFNDDGTGTRGNLGAVITAILLDPEARKNKMSADHKIIRGKLREPMMRLTAVARMLGDTSAIQSHYPISNTSDSSSGLGQAPFQSPSVFNFFRPNFSPPTSELGEKGYVAPEFQVLTGSAIPGSINFVNDYIDSADKRLMNRDWTTLETYAAKSKRIVNFLTMMMTTRHIPADDIKQMITYLDGITQDNKRAKAALQLIVSHPDFIIQR